MPQGLRRDQRKINIVSIIAEDTTAEIGVKARRL
jgi:hypothetical protein